MTFTIDFMITTKNGQVTVYIQNQHTHTKYHTNKQLQTHTQTNKHTYTEARGQKLQFDILYMQPGLKDEYFSKITDQILTWIAKLTNKNIIYDQPNLNFNCYIVK